MLGTWSSEIGRRLTVSERFTAATPARRVVVERFDRGHGKHGKRNHHREHGYPLVTVYYVDGRYYDRYDPRFAHVREVLVYERDGRFYRED